MIQAPSVTSLRVKKLAANFIHIEWDNAGGNFYYIVERRVLTQNRTIDNQEADEFWVELGTTANTEWFDDSVFPGYTYKYRVRSTFQTFQPSEWVETDTLLTFPSNAYIFTKMNNFHPSTSFLNEKFVNNNQRYVNFDNDVIMAGLMRDDFTYNPEISHLSSVEDSFVVDKERHEVQGDLSAVCVDRNRVMLSEMDGVLYLFERFQQAIKVSNDRGQNWVYYKAFNGRVGNPVSDVVTYQSSTTTYVLGYNEIFFGRPSSDIRWSSNDVRFSDNENTYTKLGEDDNIGFPVELFSTYIDLPAELNKRAESMANSNSNLYVGGRNKVFVSDLLNPIIGSDGKKKWDPKPIRVTSDKTDRCVIKKLDYMDDKLYALVSGRVKVNEAGVQLDPTKPENVEQSEFDGIYVMTKDSDGFIRIFGSTEEERSHIVHSKVNMSTNGTEIFFDYSNYTTELLEDKELPKENEDVNSAVKYSKRPYFATDKKEHSINFRTKEFDFKPSPVRYYGESQYTWCAREGTRAWISPNYKAVVVYPTRRYEYIVDEDKNFTKEIWDYGNVQIKLDNIRFSGFSNYSNGILLYKNTGEIIGFYEFNYRVRDEVNIYWKPDRTMLVGELIQQTRPDPIPEQPDVGLVDPDLSPLLSKMAPEHYMKDDGMMQSFATNYLKYLSTGESSYYNRLKNLIRNKYPREENNFEHLYSEINRRNIYLDKEKRDLVVRFFESRSSDFYSTKGVIDSYKFVFKLLYNADVELDVESMDGMEYDIVVRSGDVTEDIVGTTVYTPTGRANVTYIDREYENGILQWRITIHNLIGKFVVGQTLKSEVMPNFNAGITVGVRGKELTHNNIDYINRGRVHYTMTLKSELPVGMYKDAVLRFVHPVGFGFRGITLISVLINSGISLKHQETIVNIMKSYRWDAGLPTVFPEATYQRDGLGNIINDPVTGKPILVPHPHAGKDPVADMGLWPEYEKTEGAGALKKRRPLNPTLDAGWLTYCYYSILSGHMTIPKERVLKDNHGLPRDPKDPTQIKVE